MKQAGSIIVISLLLGAAALVLRGCQPRTAAPTTSFDGAPLDETAIRGRAVYLRRCSSCHTALPVRRYAPTTWRKVLAEMSRRAKLSPGDHQAVRHYVESQLGRTVGP